jgi:NodT family efflux transporter outer membrane factor (OMF) lipoprotein
MQRQTMGSSFLRGSSTRLLDGLLKSAGLFCAGFLLCSCAAIPHLGPMPQPIPVAELESVRSFGAPAGDWPAQNWWASFQDPQLDKLIGEALDHSPSMVEAQARLQDAVARTGEARSALYPTLGANASVTRDKLSYNSIFPAAAVPRGWNDMGRTTLDFSWELDFWGKNRSALHAAVSETDAAEADAAGARLLLTTSVADAYVRLQYLFVRRDVAAQSLRNRQDSLRLVQRRFAQGLDAQVSIEEASAREDLAKADLAEADEQIQLARNGIAALLGRGPDRGLDITRPELSARRSVGLPPTIQADLLGRKPEVVAARWRVEAAAKRIGVAKASFYPDVNLTAFLGFESLGLSNLTSAGSNVGGFGPALHLPIFEGGRLRANYRSARAEYDLAVANYNDALTQALRETADAARSLTAQKDRLVATDAGLSRSETAYALAKKRYDGGLADFQTVLTAEDALLQAQIADTAIHMRGYSLDVALVKALGGGFESPSKFQEQVKL